MEADKLMALVEVFEGLEDWRNAQQTLSTTLLKIVVDKSDQRIQTCLWILHYAYGANQNLMETISLVP